MDGRGEGGREVSSRWVCSARGCENSQVVINAEDDPFISRESPAVSMLRLCWIEEVSAVTPTSTRSELPGFAFGEGLVESMEVVQEIIKQSVKGEHKTAVPQVST